MIQRVHTGLEKLGHKLFPIRYSTLKEYFFWLMIWPLAGMWYCVIPLKWEFFTSDIYTVVVFFLANIFALCCGSYKPAQWLFKKVGKKYKGKIVGAEKMYGMGESTFYLLIEFKRGKKTLIRKTSGYQGGPSANLKNNKCYVYEFLGKFIEADFNVKKRYSEEEDDSLCFPITKHKLFMPKGDKYV